MWTSTTLTKHLPLTCRTAPSEEQRDRWEFSSTGTAAWWWRLANRGRATHSRCKRASVNKRLKLLNLQSKTRKHFLKAFQIRINWNSIRITKLESLMWSRTIKAKIFKFAAVKLCHHFAIGMLSGSVTEWMCACSRMKLFIAQLLAESLANSLALTWKIILGNSRAE